MTPLPLTLLTGFLGSGKSTFLSDVLRDPAFGNSAVIVNEFGEVGLDDFLVTHSEEQIMEMTTGCLCCTVRGDITETIFDLFEKSAKGEIKKFDRILVETTGLADPVPVLQTLLSHQGLREYVRPAGVLTLVDAANGLSTLDKQPECVKQIALADAIILTKTDLDIDIAALDDLRQRIKSLNPAALMVDRNAADFDCAKLVDKMANRDSRDPETLTQWLGESDDHGHDHNHEHHHDHGHHHHDVNRHGDNIFAFTLTWDHPLSSQAMGTALQMLIHQRGEDILRMKGIVTLEDNPDMPIVLHLVQHVFHEPIELERWPSDDHRSRLVFITRGIVEMELRAYFENWLDPQHQHILESKAEI